MVAADASGLAISLTTTINTNWGSQVCDPRTGVLMNNNMADFSTPGQSNYFGYRPSVSNFIRPGKRPLSSTSPIIVDYPDGEFFMALGCAGGSRIITTTVQNLWHIFEQAKSLVQALAMPRFHDQLVPNEILVEPDYDRGVIAYLRSLGHIVKEPMPKSSAQGLTRSEDGVFVAASEPRQANSGGYAV